MVTDYDVLKFPGMTVSPQAPLCTRCGSPPYACGDVPPSGNSCLDKEVIEVKRNMRMGFWSDRMHAFIRRCTRWLTHTLSKLKKSKGEGFKKAALYDPGEEPLPEAGLGWMLFSL